MKVKQTRVTGVTRKKMKAILRMKEEEKRVWVRGLPRAGREGPSIEPPVGVGDWDQEQRS